MISYLQRCTLGGHGGKSDDVAEIYGDAVEIFSFDFVSSL